MFKPLLAPQDDPMRNPKFFEKLKYPLMASAKYDGIRCCNLNGICQSRTNKPLPNKYVQEKFSPFQELDGELIAGDPTHPDAYNRTYRLVMSNEKEIDTCEDTHVKFYVFDDLELSSLDRPFKNRFETATNAIDMLAHDDIVMVEHVWVEDYDQLMYFEEQCLKQGFEGIMMRRPDMPYKLGRSTLNQGHLVKLKRFTDDEAVVVDFVEQMHNGNAAFINETGNTARSTAKEGLVPAGQLGKFIAKWNDMDIEVAPGVLKHFERKHIWENQEDFRGMILKFRHFAYGVVEKPRFPRFVGWRDPIDMGEA